MVSETLVFFFPLDFALALDEVDLSLEVLRL
jgi:hypothetical protein